MLKRTSFPPVSRPLTRWWVWSLPLFAGLLLALVAIPYPWSFLTPPPLAWTFLLIARAECPKRAFWVGFWAGVGFFALHLMWLPISFTALFGPVIILPMLFLPPILGSFWGLTAGLCRLAGRYTLAALPFAWVVMEYLRSLGVFGFTWGTLGYAFLPTPLIQVADLGGVYLVSLLAAGTAAALAALYARRWLPSLVMTGLLLGASGYGLTRPEPPIADQDVLLVQGSVDPFDKAESRSLDELELYAALSQQGLARNGDIDLVIWPEGASPLSAEDAEVTQVLGQLGTSALVGAPNYDTGYQNSAYGFSGMLTNRYSKVKLVPFGETFPLQEALGFIYNPIFSAIGLPGLRGATPGNVYEPLEVGDFSAATYICYESTFPQVARIMVQKGATVLVNISNDAWFGRTVGAEQHFQMGRVRAIETRRYLARAGNDGISAVINPLGQTVSRFPRGERAAFAAQVGLSEEQTLYVRFGDWVVWASAVVLVFLAAAAFVAWWQPRKGERCLKRFP